MHKDDKLEAVKARIRALQRMTIENGCTESEAMVAAAKVQEILLQWGLSLADVEDIRRRGAWTDEALDGSVALRFQEMKFCVVSLSEFFDCECWGDHGGGVSFLGLKQDVFAAMTLFEIVADAMDLKWADYREHKRRLPLGWQQDPLQSERIRGAFLGAMACRISQRLLAAKAQLRAEVSRNALVLVKKDIIASKMSEMGLELTKGEALVLEEDNHASLAGSFAGASVDLSNPFKVTD